METGGGNVGTDGTRDKLETVGQLGPHGQGTTVFGSNRDCDGGEPAG